MDVGDVNLSGLCITLKPKGKRTNRTVFFSEECRSELARWLQVRAGTGAKDPALFLGEERVRLQVGGLGDVVKAAAMRAGLHDPVGPLEKRFTPHCCRHWWNTYLFLAGLEERYRGYLRGDVPDGSQGQYIHMDALQKEIKMVKGHGGELQSAPIWNR